MQRKSIFRLMLTPIFFVFLGLFQMGTVQEATVAQPSPSSAQIQTPIRAIIFGIDGLRWDAPTLKLDKIETVPCFKDPQHPTSQRRVALPEDSGSANRRLG